MSILYPYFRMISTFVIIILISSIFGPAGVIYLTEVGGTGQVEDDTGGDEQLNAMSSSRAQTISVGIFNHPDESDISYWTGGNGNSYSNYQTVLNNDAESRFSITILTSLTTANLNSIDVLLLPDNAVPDSSLNDVKNWFVPGKGIIAADSAVCYLSYSGFMFPASAGSNGVSTYWSYDSNTNDQKIELNHDITEDYTVGNVYNSISNDAVYYRNMLPGNAIVLSCSNSNSNYAYVVAREVPSKGRIVGLGPYASVPSGLEELVRDAAEWSTGPGELTVTGADIAPVSVPQNAMTVNMANITFKAVNGSVVINKIKINMTGNGSDSDISGVSIVRDMDGNGIFSQKDTFLKFATFSNKKLEFNDHWPILQSIKTTFLIVFNISKTAVCGHTVGVKISIGDISVRTPSTVLNFTTIQSTNTMIIEKTDYLEVKALDIAPNSVEQGQADVPVMYIQLKAVGGNVLLNSLGFAFTGCGVCSDIAGARLYRDENANGEFDKGADTEIGTGNFVSAFLDFDGMAIIINENSVLRLFVLLSIDDDSIPENTVGVRLESDYVKIRAPDMCLQVGPYWGGPMLISEKGGADKPPSPTGLVITGITHNSISLTWDRVSGVDLIGYNIYRSNSGSPASWGKPVGEMPVGIEEFTDGDLEELTTYHYTVTVFDESAVESDFSSPVEGTTLLGPRPPVVNNPQADFSIAEDTVDEDTIDLLDWFSDPNGDTLKFRCDDANHLSVEIDQDTGAVRIVPKQNWNGIETLYFYAADAEWEVKDDVIITVTPVNDPPEKVTILEPRNATNFENGSKIKLRAIFYDPDLAYGDIVVLVWRSNISGLLGTGELMLDVVLPPGENLINVEATDVQGESAMDTTIVIIVPDTKPDTNGKPDDGGGGPDTNISGDDEIDDEFLKGKDDEKMDMVPVLIGLIVIIILVLVLTLLFIYTGKRSATVVETNIEKEPEQVNNGSDDTGRVNGDGKA